MSSPAVRPAPVRGRGAPGLAALCAGVLAAGLALAGCGGSDGSGGSAGSDPSTATRACRARWEALEKTYAGRGDADLPSELPNRWTSYLAGVDYQRATAGAGDCGATLKTQQDQAEVLERFELDLRPYDMTYQLQRVAGGAQAFVAAATGKPRQAPKAKAVSTALAALTANAPGSYQEQSAGWDQLDTVDLVTSNAAAVAAAVKDLRVLSSEGYRYQICQTSLATIRRQTATVVDAPEGGPTTSPSPTPSGAASPSGTASPSPTP